MGENRSSIDIHKFLVKLRERIPNPPLDRLRVVTFVFIALITIGISLFEFEVD